ncbi:MULTISPECIES: universal stress protein [unclassified Arcicella]|uniref:universal stress protein n=1 Tax=unclassified Arcicella TaxID=2644986 RepID=UPI002863071A|nr:MULTISPECIES: universal stress protein [unclassified Arcicella]MDR6560767.1 nucleotide-binding universal stress UspA family protein [Arcicella sp. BE51]MDR6810651.1 nucleotide-binding universal stress UspA family protein [Arcicella sp. BE140]MDR6822001.1 nucleotide-binding universal stress UspA family protein [Arcicella sp. BE139]
MKNILVATDFSENSHKTLEYAILIAKAYDAKIYLVHTYLPYYVEPGIYADSLLMMESLNEQTKSMYAKFVPFEKEIEAAGIAYETVLELNDVTSGIFDVIEKHEIDLLVIGRTGSGGFLNKLIGSNAAHIIAKSSIPVLAIPQNVENVAIKQVLYATQLEFDESDILAQVFAITSQLKAKVNLVKVEASFEPDIQSDQQFIDQIKGTFIKEDFEISKVKDEHVTDGILKAAKAQGADLIVLAAHHRNFLSQIIDPSKSKQVIIRSPLPVLTFQFKEEL